MYVRILQRVSRAVLLFSLFFCILWRPFLLYVFEPPRSGGFALSQITLLTTLGLLAISLIMLVYHLAVPRYRPTFTGRNVFALEVVVLFMLTVTFFSLVND